MARECSPGAIWNLPKCGWVIKWMWGKQQCWKWGFSVLIGTRVASVCCRLWAGHRDWSLIPSPWLLKTSALQIARNRKKNIVLKSSFSAWFDMTSEVQMPPILRFLYRMIWYLQLINFPLLNRIMRSECNNLRHAVLDIVSYQVHVYIVVTSIGQKTDNSTKKLVADLDRCKSSNLILFKGESNWIQSNENTILKTVCFVCIDFMTHCEVI